jgi:hypothetical protein
MNRVIAPRSCTNRATSYSHILSLQFSRAGRNLDAVREENRNSNPIRCIARSIIFPSGLLRSDACRLLRGARDGTQLALKLSAARPVRELLTA